VLCLLAALIVAAIAPAILGKLEMFSLGTVFGGLIGVLRIPSQRSVTVDNAPENPVQTEEAK
jgi:hypothetical protein